MADNEYYFHELDLRNQFQTDVEEIFSDDEVIEGLGAEVYVIGKKRQDDTTFPCIYVDIEDSSVSTQYSSTLAMQRFTNFTVTFDIYSKELDDYAQDDAVIRISEILIHGFQLKYRNMAVTLNRILANLDSTVSRKQVRFEGMIDNSDNYIYLS